MGYSSALSPCFLGRRDSTSIFINLPLNAAIQKHHKAFRSKKACGQIEQKPVVRRMAFKTRKFPVLTTKKPSKKIDVLFGMAERQSADVSSFHFQYSFYCQ